MLRSTVPALCLTLCVACGTTEPGDGSATIGMTADDTGSAGATTGATTESGGTESETGGDGDVTWDSGMQQFFADYCVTCHTAGDPENRDFTTIDHVLRDAATIRCGVAATQQAGCGASPAPKQFPIADPRPTDAERDVVVAWIDRGLP